MKEKRIGNIDGIFPRLSQLIRPAVANVTQIAVVIAAKSPPPDFDLLDKLLVTAECKNLNIIICINKIDLDCDKEYENTVKAYEKAGYTIIPLSSKQGLGLEELKAALSGKTTVFAGQSGVGKSTILNGVISSWVMETGEISEKIKRGKHTTRHAELLELKSGGFVVDTPGFSTFELSDIRYDELELFYPEFNGHTGKCKFARCSHTSEPECNVLKALEKDLIDCGRHKRYTQYYNELKQIKDYDKNKKVSSKRGGKN